MFISFIKTQQDICEPISHWKIIKSHLKSYVLFKKLYERVYMHKILEKVLRYK